MKKLWVLFSCLFVSGVLFAKPPVAFELSASFDSKDTIVLHWSIEEGSYLYRDHIAIEPELGSGLLIGHYRLPHAETKIFPGGVEYAVYHDDFSVKVPISYVDHGRLGLHVSYQGCSELGFCYAPVEVRLRLSMDKQTIFIDTVAAGFSSDLAHDQFSAESILAQHNMFWVVLVFIGLGFLLSLTPCVLPMVPILSSIIVGQGKNIRPLRAFSLSLVYVLTMAVTYALLGLAVASAGNYLQALWQETWVIVTFSVLFVLLALSMFGLYEFRLPLFIEERIGLLSRRTGGGTYLGVIIMGFLATMILSPCVTAPLVGVLSYIAVTGDKVLGAAALFSLALGMGIPLLVIGTSTGFLLPRAGSWLESVRLVFGVVMLGLAIFLVQRVLPGSVVLLLWGVLLVIVSAVLGSFKAARTRIRKAFRAIGLIIFAYACALFIGGAVGYESPFYPFQQVRVQSQQVAFTDVGSMLELQALLKQAKFDKKPVMIYFHASWCIACKDVESYVFTDARVKRVLGAYELLRVDISRPSPDITPIENMFDVIAPPTMVFIDESGQQLKAATIVGEISAERFLARLGVIIKQ